MIRGYRKADYMLEALAYIKDYKYDSTRTKTPENEKESKN